jgi:hypothetical protein
MGNKKRVKLYKEPRKRTALTQRSLFAFCCSVDTKRVTTSQKQERRDVFKAHWGAYYAKKCTPRFQMVTKVAVKLA